MQARLALIACGAVAALSATTHVRGDGAPLTLETIDVGTFVNTEYGEIGYEGQFGEFISTTLVNGNANRIDIDLGGLLNAFGADLFTEVRVIDTGENVYGINSAGADVDLFVLTGLDTGVDVLYDYLGPSPTHNNDSSADLATRVSAIDAVGGVHEWEDLLHMSLGYQGMVSATLSTPQGPGTAPPLPGEIGPMLRIREAGFQESFRVELTAASVPAPGALGLLGLAALMSRRRRRR